MNLPRFALNKSPIILAITLILVLWGITVFLTAPRREDPEFIIRDAVINTAWPGATAEKVEQLVTDKIEKAVANIKWVKRTTSTSYVGRSVVEVRTLDEITDVDKVWTKVRAELKLLEPQLPDGCRSPEVDDNFGDTAALVLAIYQDPESAKKRKYTPRELEIFAKRLRDRLMDLRPQVKGHDGRMIPNSTEPAYVARLDLYGVQPEVIYLETDMGLWGKLKLTTDDLRTVLAQRNIIAPGGILETDTSRVHARLTGDFNATREVNRVVVARVATGAKSPVRQTVPELIRQITAGEEPGGGRPPSMEVPVYLEDLNIKVLRGYLDPPESITRFGDAETSMESIFLSFTLKSGQNITQLGEVVDTLLATANETFLPPDVEVRKISNPPAAVEKKINEVVANLADAVIIVLLVLLFLAGWRVASVTAASIPIVMLCSIGLMRIWNVQIEQISLAALIVALGLLVDNATVVCDNTRRFLNQGLTPEEAAIEGPDRVSSSLLMGTLTTVAVFIPMTFALTGGTKEYVFSLPVVVSLTLLISWLSALTVTAIMTRHLLSPTEGPPPFVKIFKWIRQRVPGKEESGETSMSTEEKTHWYVRACSIAIQNKFVTVGVAFGLLFGSFMLPVKSSFFPNADRPQFVVDILLPEGSPLHRTDAVTKKVEQIVRRLNTTTWEDGELRAITDKKGKPVPRLDNMAIYVGAGGPRFYTGLDPKPNASNYAIIWVNTNDAEQNSRYIADIRRAAWEGIGQPGDDDHIPPIAGARIVPKPLVLGTPVPSPIEYRLLGPRLANEKVLRHYNEKLKEVLRTSGLVWDVHDSWGELGDQLDVDIRVTPANMAGATNATVAQTLNAYYTGHYLTTYREGDHQVPILLRLPPQQRRSLDSLRNAYVEGYTGKVPLDSVADLQMKRRPVKTTRYQAERIMSVLARPEFGILSREVLERLRPHVDEIAAQLPPGYRIEDGGIEEEAARGERQNGASLSIGAALILLCLIIQYNSWVKPLMIILTVPLAIIGGMLGLWVRGIPMGFMETLGFLALFGTILNAAILIIDFAEGLITEKLARGEGSAPPGDKSYSGLTREAFRECLTETGRIRMMPILMTTLTTVGGLITLMFAGPLFKGLATVFAVGLALGTGITLFVLPAIMAIMVENFGMKLGKPPKQVEPATQTGSA